LASVQDWNGKNATICCAVYKEKRIKFCSYLKRPTYLSSSLHNTKALSEVARHSWLILQS
jgi:hypothetical protein